MNMNNFTNYILNNEDLDNINLNNLGFPISFILNNYSPFNLNSMILDSQENSDNKSDISIGHLTSKEINILNSNCSDNNNNNQEYFKSEERSEKTVNLKNEKISNYSTIFTKGIYDNYSKQMIYEAMNETKKKVTKLKIRAPIFSPSILKSIERRKKISYQGGKILII